MSARQRKAKRSACAEQARPAPFASATGDVLLTVLRHLPLQQRVHASAVCRAWREATLAPSLWTQLTFRLPRDDDDATSAAFLAWLQPRTGQVESLHIDIVELSPQPLEGAVGVVWGHLVAALLYVAGSLQHLELETSGPLVISQWAAALTQLRSACFIGGEVQLKLGLGKLQRLTDLEFGSNTAELEVESPACWPPSVTHLSLEHCSLSRLPPSLTRMSQLRSLDLSQNTFNEDTGEETAPLGELTGLECLKLANCRMSQVPPELSALRQLRILHMGGNLEEEFGSSEDAEVLEAALRPLRALQVLVVSQCQVALPAAVCRMPRLERLFVTSTPVAQLPPGPYCKRMRHLCVDWDVAFESMPMLQQCGELEMLTLARPHRVLEPDSQTEEQVEAMASALKAHPTLKQVNLVAVQGRGLHLSIATMRFVVALAQAPALCVEVVDTWDSDVLRIPSLIDIL